MNEPAAATTKRMKLPYAGTCRGCGVEVPADVVAVYDKVAKNVTCLGCTDKAPEAPVPVDDWWITSIDRIDGAANDVHEALGHAMNALYEARSRRLAGVGHLDIAKGLVARGGRETRLAPTAACREFEAAMTDCRALMIRALVDEDHLTITQVGELIGVTRQRVGLLYHRAAGSGPADSRV
jgi:hypothetical protein